MKKTKLRQIGIQYWAADKVMRWFGIYGGGATVYIYADEWNQVAYSLLPRKTGY